MTPSEAAANEIREARLLELDREFEHPDKLEPGDFTKRSLASRWNISDNAALERMRKMAKKDPSWRLLTVWDPSISHEVTVLRKVG